MALLITEITQQPKAITHIHSKHLLHNRYDIKHLPKLIKLKMMPINEKYDVI